MISVPVLIALASSSPARRRLLRDIVGDFEVVEPQIDEGRFAAHEPGRRALSLAEAKAREVAARRPGVLVIGADTLVVCRGEVIGKPADRQDAIRILEKLTGSVHTVVTGLFVLAPDGRERSCCVEVSLRMRRMSRREVEAYVDGPGALGRAGVYGLQHDDPNVEGITGSASSVMGLPVEKLTGILSDLYPSGGAGG